jgi:hypothetical protein
MNIKIGVACVLCIANMGCTIALLPADKLAGFSNPKLRVTRTWGGFTAEAGTNFEGDVDVQYDPETKAFRLVGKIVSDVSGVVGAEGERADHLVALREIESDFLKAKMQYALESQRIVGENFQAFGTMLAIATAAGGDAVQKVINAAVPILAGSKVDIAGVVGASLGTPPTENPVSVP